MGRFVSRRTTIGSSEFLLRAAFIAGAGDRKKQESEVPSVGRALRASLDLLERIRGRPGGTTAARVLKDKLHPGGEAG